LLGGGQTQRIGDIFRDFYEQFRHGRDRETGSIGVRWEKGRVRDPY
jgi:hypothetical protein